MSGAEAFAVFGIACNVMAVISFSHETYSIYSKIRENGSPQPDLEARNKYLKELLQNIEDHIANSPSAPTTRQKLLKEIAEKCKAVATELEGELLKIVASQQRPRFKKVVVTWKTLWKKRKIEGLEKEMKGYQEVLQSGLLSKISNTSEATAIQQNENFNSLDSKLKVFIAQYAQGHTQLSDLLRQKAESTQRAVAEDGKETRMLVAKNGKKTREVFSKRFDEHADSIADKKAQEKLFDSLYFPQMNDHRENGVKDPYTNTFRWVLYPKDASFEDDESGFKDYEIEARNKKFKNAEWDDFVAWLQADSTSNSEIYWINGKPGSGKSTLMKYLVKSNRMKELVDCENRHDHLILSYFFKLSGTDLQKSIKGMLCTLLYQLLVSERHLIPSLLQTHPEVAAQRSVSDWSMDYAWEMFKFVISCSNRPLCIFIDGLDELCSEDDSFVLFAKLRQLAMLPNTKLCVSSRPETIFNNQFSTSPGLKLQDLTCGDIMKYVRDFFKPDEHSVLRHLTEYIVNASEGVFLWVYLVVRLMKRDLEHKNTFEELLKRLETTPKDLTKLYEDMWLRYSLDEPIYQIDTAAIFNLVLNREKCRLPNSETSLLECVFARQPEICDSILKNNHKFDCDDITKECREAQLLIETRCFGMLEIGQDLNWPYVRSFDNVFPPLLPFSNMGVRFIHRTAREFLGDSLRGLEILQKDTSSLETRIYRQWLAYLTCLSMFSCGFIQMFIGQINGISRIASHLSEDKQSALLNICQNLWERHRSVWLLERDRWNSRLELGKTLNHPLFYEQGDLDFLGWASRWGFKHCVMNSLNAHPVEDTISLQYKSYLLRMAALFDQDWDQSQVSRNCELICSLLEKGANPELFWRFDAYHVTTTPIEALIYSLANIWRYNASNDLETIAQTLEKMLKGVDLDKPIFSILKFDATRIHQTNHQYDSPTPRIYIETSIRQLLPILYSPHQNNQLDELIFKYSQIDWETFNNMAYKIILMQSTRQLYGGEDWSDYQGIPPIKENSAGRCIVYTKCPLDQDSESLNLSLKEVGKVRPHPQNDEEQWLPDRSLKPIAEIEELIRKIEDISRREDLPQIDVVEGFLVSKGLYEPGEDIVDSLQKYGLDLSLINRIEDCNFVF